MEGADESTELRRHQISFLFISVAFLIFIHNFPTLGDFKSLGSFLVGLFCNLCRFFIFIHNFTTFGDI